MSSHANLMTGRVRDKRTYVCQVCGPQRRMPRLCLECRERVAILTKETYELVLLEAIARMRGEAWSRRTDGHHSITA